MLLSQAAPLLRFVDFVGFAMRARGLWEGHGRLVDPLYPIGYPALLLATRLLVGDVLLAGKILALAAGVGACLAAARLLRPSAGWLLLGLPVMLVWGPVEGTDVAAAALGLGGLAAAGHKRPALAGLLVAGACMCRYTAIAALPAALLLATGGRLRLLAALGLGLLPHLGLALATGSSPWPDQSYNLAIAAGRPTALWSMDTLRRWPDGLRHAVEAMAAPGLGRALVLLGAAGLLRGLVARDRKAAALLLFGGLHLGLIGLAFASERLVLPATFCASLGLAWWLPGRRLAPVALVLLAWGLLHPPEEDPHRARLDALVQAMDGLPGPFLSTDPWVYSRHEGWLQQGVPPRAAGPDRQLQPHVLVAFAKEQGFRIIVADRPRVRRSYPGLEPLLKEGPIDGLKPLPAPDGWFVWEVLGAEAALKRPGPPGQRPP